MKLLLEKFRDFMEDDKEEDLISALEGAPLIAEMIGEHYEFDPEKPNCSDFSKRYGSTEDLSKCAEEDLERVDSYFSLLFISDYNTAPEKFKPVQANSIKYWADLMGYKEDEQGILKKIGPPTISDEQRRTLLPSILSRHRRYIDQQADTDDRNFRKLAGL